MSRRRPARRSTPRERRAWSVRFELGELRDAIEGARILADVARHTGGDNDHDRRRAPHASSAILSLVVGRLQLLERVLARDIDPRLALTPNNETGGSTADLERVAEDDLLFMIAEPK